MEYLYIKAVHIIFIVTWFSGLFYMPRLFIYATEANQKPENERVILQQQLGLMAKRLWLGITWPSAVLTAIMGGWIAYLYGNVPGWLWIKLGFVVLLYIYHFSLHRIFLEQRNGLFRYSSMQLRIWNEVATVMLVAIVMLVSVKSNLSAIYGLLGLFILILLLLAAIRIYAIFRKKRAD